MGRLENRLRKKWQDYGGHNAANAEHTFYDIFDNLFEGSDLKLIRQPKKFDRIYVDVPLEQWELDQIYIPDQEIDRHGIKPDGLICNTANGKEIYVEIKRQDGWVEGKDRKAGRGNAHERLCKYFTPGLLNMMREESGVKAPAYPFWIVFQGDITRDICRVREIRFWFDGNTTNLTFWRDTRDPQPLIEHFIRYILPLLED